METTKKMNYNVRMARREDCPEIMRLIQELANYEKMPDGPKIGVEVLADDGFGDEPFYQCLVAENSGAGEGKLQEKLVGYCLYFFTYSTWEGRCIYMEDLYVTPAARKQGLGKALWRECVKVGLSRRCTRCSFSVLNWNTPSIDFYKRMGAVDHTAKDGWLAFRMEEESMKNFAKE